MKFEKLKFEHLSQMAEIESEAFASPWTINMFIPELASEYAHYIVGVVDDKVVCYGGFHQSFDEAHIMNIAVKKEFRGCGYGKLLLSHMIAKAKLLGIDKATLEVSVNNVVAFSLYEQYGFATAGIRKNYYSDGSDAIIMWADLK